MSETQLRQRREHSGMVSHPGNNSTFPTTLDGSYRLATDKHTIDAITRTRTMRALRVAQGGRVARLLAMIGRWF